MEEILAAELAQRRVGMSLLTAFAAVAFALAATGLYGVLAYSVAQRKHELGVRIALGARPGDVLRLSMWRGMRLALIGLAIGLGASLALRRALQTVLFGVSPHDPATFAAVSLLLLSVAAAAAYIPARRATRVDPAIALRAE
jgi:putative ABC transport system permease protein